MGTPSLRGLARPKASKSPKKRFLIVCSSDLECHYLRWMSHSLNHSDIVVDCVVGGDLDQLLARAKFLMNQARKKPPAYDEVWCLADSPPDATTALGAGRSRIRIAGSSPTFVSWLLLHFLDADAVAASADPLATLHTHMKNLGTEPHLAMNHLAGRHTIALEHGKSPVAPASNVPALVQAIRASLDGFNGGNPTTPPFS